MAGKDSSASDLDATLIVMVLLCVGSTFLMNTTFKSMNQASTKPYVTFDQYYPFYISQHADQTCRRLHFVGTSLIILFSLYEYHVITSLIMAGIVGYGIFKATSHIEHGFFELGIMMLVFVLFMRKLTGSWAKGLMVPVVAYGFAWVGHYFFEHNKPATFIYPIYSLFGDFKLWYEIFSLQRKF